MVEEVPESLAIKRFDKYSNGLCECCKKKLIKNRRGRDLYGAWEAHHRFPNRSVSIDNIRIVCSTGINCHLNHCHKGDYQNKPVWEPCNRFL